MWPNPFTEEILNGKLYFLCSAGILFYARPWTSSMKIVFIYDEIRNGVVFVKPTTIRLMIFSKKKEEVT